jgi:ABC-2 type transport system permease protein
MVKKDNHRDAGSHPLRIRHLGQMGLWVVIILLVAYLSSFLWLRLDLTSDRRFTLSKTTKEVLRGMDDMVFITVYLEGDMPLGFKRMRREVHELLEEYRVINRRNIGFEFVNPSASDDPKLRSEFQKDLVSKGLTPTDVYERRKDGGTDQRILFPGAILHYRNRNISLNLLRNNPGISAEQNLNNSIETLEYAFTDAMKTLTSKEIKKVAFVEGHGELTDVETDDITTELSRHYEVYRGFIDAQNPNLDEYSVVIIAGPRKRWEEKEKFVIDQYLMNGGHLVWLIDPVEVYQDSLSAGETTLALVRDLNLDDQLFRYGVRINPTLVKDIQCALIPVNTATAGEQPHFTPAPWYYYPLLAPRTSHPITRNLNLVKAQYASVIDTLGGDREVKKTSLLVTSQYTRVVEAPLFISLRQIDEAPVQAQYNKSFLPVAVLLQGTFPSVFSNRIIRSYTLAKGKSFAEKSKPTAMIVISDADIIRNEVRWRGTQSEPLPLGYDRYMKQTFGNRDFIMNAVSYLTDDAGLMELRVREYRLRLLDKTRLSNQLVLWKTVNMLLPIVLVVLAGGLVLVLRKRKFTRV